MRNSTFLYVLLVCTIYSTTAFAQGGAKDSMPCSYEYFELITSSDNMENYLCSFRVLYKDQLSYACAQLNDLSDFLSKVEKKSDEISNRLQVIEFLYKEKPLKVDVPFDRLDTFILSSNTAEVDKIASKGQKYFLQYYFDRTGILRKGRKGSDAAIMKYLQKWCILASREHESGYLMIKAKIQKIDY